MAYGTLSILDTLRANFQTIADFGEDRAYEGIQKLLDAHNMIMQDMMSDVIERTTDRNRRYGTTDQMVMTKGNEFSRPDASKILPGAVAGFPLELFEASLQWTRKYFQTATVSEIAGQFVALRDADIQRVIREVTRAIFNPLDYTVTDYLVDRLQQIQLQVRALLNADGQGIPPGPNGETYNANTHTHYLATNSFVMSDMVGALETVLEHYANGQACIYIARGSEAAIRTFTPNFVPLLNTGIWASNNTARFQGPGTLMTVPINNRLIGEFNGAEVWIKPWIPANYIFVFLKDQPKPLVMRTRTATSGALELVADDERAPLRAKSYQREFGIGVWNRPNGACLFTGGSVYVAPVLAF